jgi:ATP-binding cassette subfamily F protein 3
VKPRNTLEKGAARTAPQPQDRDRKRKEAERRQERTKKLRPLQTALDKLEKKIAEQEGRKKQIESSLGDPAVCQSPERVSALSVEYRELTTNLAYSYDDWAKLEGEVEKADRETAG